MFSEHPFTHHTESTINILLYLLYHIYPLSPSYFYIGFTVHSRHSTLQSYTLNVNIIRYSLIFAYGSLPGIFFKIKFPSAIIGFLM